MNISELIKKLQEIQNEDGDLDVRVYMTDLKNLLVKWNFIPIDISYIQNSYGIQERQANKEPDPA